jgi:hypothetical protein
MVTEKRATTLDRSRGTAPDRRLRAAYALAARIVARRHDREVRDVAVNLLAGRTVDGATLPVSTLRG